MVQVIKKKFVVIGKEGSTLDGEGFIQKLWNDANSHFNEIAHLAKKDVNGNFPAGTVNYMVYEKLKKFAKVSQKN